LGIRRPWWGVNSWKFNLMLMLRKSGNRLPLHHISRAQISRKSRTHLKILNIIVVTHSKFHIEAPKLLRATVTNSVTIATPFRVICSSLFFRRESVRPHQVEKKVTCTTIEWESAVKFM
jgi:hypothetical protein